MNALTNIPVEMIRADASAQPRDRVDTDVIATYTEDMKAGATFPAVIVYHDGAVYWLADGFHRLYAAMGAGVAKMLCDVRKGGLRDAVLHSAGANAEHGYRRSNEDKRRAVQKLLADPEWSAWSDREIARRCRVGADLVGKLRPQVLTVVSDSETSASEEPEATTVRTFKTKHGTTAKMKTSAIGRKNKSLSNAGKNPDRIENMRVNAKIWTDLREALESLSGMPLASDVVAIVRGYNSDKAAIINDHLNNATQWLMEFADAWSGSNETRPPEEQDRDHHSDAGVGDRAA